MNDTDRTTTDDPLPGQLTFDDLEVEVTCPCGQPAGHCHCTAWPGPHRHRTPL
jgi:hypothetical protein